MSRYLKRQELVEVADVFRVAGPEYLRRNRHRMPVEELKAFLLQKKIAKFKLPERLEFVAAFPLTSTGKLSKKDLREDIAAKLAQESAILP